MLTEKILVMILPAVLICAQFNDCAIAAPAAPQKKKQAKPAASSTKPSAASLSEALKQLDDSWQILENPAVKQAMAAVMGDKAGLFVEQTQQLAQPEKSGDVIFASGGIEGLFTQNESAFSFNTKTNKMQIAILADNALNVWGAANEAAICAPMQSWIAALRERRHETGSSAARMSVSLEAPGKTTITSTKYQKVGVKKNLKTGTPTGTYERASRWDGAELQVKSLGANKIKFNLSASHAANTGEASGQLVLQNNRGVYKDENIRLQFVYSGKSFSITQLGDGQFGGMGVYADGTYIKTDDKEPKFE